MKSIKTELSLMDNNYLCRGAKRNKKIDGCSIIIPVYNQWEELSFCINSLARQKVYFKFEIIIIDDKSPSVYDVKRILSYYPKNTSIFRLTKRLGAATARNIGICKARYNLLIFLDADMIVPNNFLREHFECHRNNNNDIISVSFRKHVLFDPATNKVLANIYKAPNYKSDFRYKKYVPLQWKNQYPSINKEIFGKNYYLLKETKNFLNFGYGKTVGIWTLSHMVVSSSIGIIAKNAIEVGGFDCRFKSAGYEDVHFGAKLICSGIKIVPIKNATAYHLVRNDARNSKTKVMARNRRLYYKLIGEKLKRWSRQNFVNNFKKYEKTERI